VEAVAVRAGAAEPLVLGAGLWLLLALRGLFAAAEAVARPLAAGDLAAARHALGRHLVSRPTAELDAPHVASGAVESVAENLTDGYVAPVLLFLVLGLPGAALYRAINTADAMLGYRDGPLEYFGKTAARLDDVLNLVPARLAALAIVAAAPLAAAGASARQGWVTLRRDRARTASPNAGWTMAAMAGALGVTLEKPGAYRLGSGGRAPCAADVTRSVRVVAAAAVLVTAALLLAEIGVRAALVPAR
jgi:adenosylcobinamide-phosphate synthase